MVKRKFPKKLGRLEKQALRDLKKELNRGRGPGTPRQAAVAAIRELYHAAQRDVAMYGRMLGELGWVQ